MSTAAPTPAYMDEPWFALLQAQVTRTGAVRAHIARQLGITAGALSQLLNATGLYGNGTASTARMASRVIHTYGRYPCPHLTDEATGGPDEPVVITAEQCRAYAHRPAPSSPREMKHWQSCNACPHKAASQPLPNPTNPTIQATEETRP